MASGSFRGLCAGLFYIRGILALSEEIGDFNARIDWVQRNFAVAMALDPKLIQGYFFAGVVVGRNQEGIIKGIQFLEKGLNNNPRAWQIPYWIGFNYYQLQNFLKAAEFYEKAAGFYDAPKFLKSIQPIYYYRAGEPELGVMYLEGLLQSVKDPGQLEWINGKLKWLKDIVYLEDKIKQFKVLYGHCPQTLDKLIEIGLLKDIPQDPFGGGYYLDWDSCRIKSKLSQGGDFKTRQHLECK